MTPVDQSARDRIRDAHDQTLFVDAGAGTGKTTALVARVVELVAKGVALPSVRGLAAITFTENAATELRTRIREALEQAAETRSGPAQQNCQRALDELDDAAITTLHGFAARLLLDAPLEAGLPPGFGIDDAVRASIERDRWWQSTLDDLLDDAELAEIWRYGLTLGLGHWNLEAIVGLFDANWDLLENRPYDAKKLPVLDPEPVLEPLRKLRDYAAGKGPAGDKLTAHVDTVLMPLLTEAELETDPLHVFALLDSLKLVNKNGRKDLWSAARLSKDEVIALCEAANDELATQLDLCRQGLTTSLVERVRQGVLLHAAARQRSGRLWFHDLLVLAVRLLRTDAHVRAALHRRWSLILVDEFQDTDPLQVELVHLLAGDGDGAWHELDVEAGRLFFVGDPKQSIYRFRRAEVELFTAVQDHCAQSPEARVTLSANFRSRPRVIDAVNAVFDPLLGASGTVPYSPLVAHRVTIAGDPGPDVLLLGGPAKGSMAAIRETEAAHVAATLRRARSEGWRGTDDRPLSYAAMAILVPTRTSLTALEEALDENGVPYRILSRSLVWQTDAVRDLITVLQAIDDPTDPVALVAALRHPMFGCDDDELVAWKISGGAWRYDVNPPEPLTDSRVAKAMDVLSSYHALRWWLPVNVLVDRVVRERRVVELTSAYQRPRDHWRRARFVVDQARAFLDGGGSGLTGFLRWAREQMDGDADALETVAPERDDDAVQILTIHGSKGLEFPLVALTGINVAPQNRTQVIWRTDGPPEVDLWKGFHTAGMTDAKAAETAAVNAEDLRLLYVGMTRAKDHLVLSLHHKERTTNHASRLTALLPELAAAEAVHEPTVASTAAAQAQTTSLPKAGSSDAREQFLAHRRQLLTNMRASLPTTATALALAAAAADEPADALEAAAVRVEAVDAPLPRPLARSGATLGSAVHRALELVQLDAPADGDIETAVAAAVADLGVPQLAAQVEARVRSALASEVIRDAAKRRHWKEVPLVATVSGRIVEGIIDLLVETPDGLVVVDYKATAASDEKVQHYAPQLQAYAGAVSQATALPVARATLLFVGAASTEARDVLLSAGA